jgi:signal transduction histidine kinase
MFNRPRGCHYCIMLADGRRPLLVAAGVLGIAGEAVAYGWSSVGSWVPDLAVGWALVACGIVAGRRSGMLLSCAGLAWFAGNFAVAGLPAVAWIGWHATYLHRALVAQAVLVFPDGRSASRWGRAVAAAAYVVALWPALATSSASWIALAAAVCATSGREARPAAAAFALGVGGASAGHLLLAPSQQDWLRWLYDAGLVLTGAALVIASVRMRARPTLAERAVELGATVSMRDGLQRVLGDPSLELAFARHGGYVDERGLALVLPGSSAQAATRVAPSGAVVVVHDPSVDFDGFLTGSVIHALRLTAENARLQADVLEQLEEVRASHRRLVLARGRQRALLARRLREGVERQLGEIEALLATIDPREPAAAEAVLRARRHVGEAREGIASLALGLQPPLLAAESLARSLAALVERSPVPVVLRVDGRRYDAAIEHSVYLVCSEALANVAKHAAATCVEVRLGSARGELRLEVVDNGRGGADPGGSGLRGLRERVEELGGMFMVESVQGEGTRVVASIPVRVKGEKRPGLEQRPVGVGAAT